MEYNDAVASRRQTKDPRPESQQSSLPMPPPDYDPVDPLKGALQCPHGNHHATMRQDDELRWVCNICGGPQVRVEKEGAKLSGAEKEPLREAARARGRRIAWRGTGLFSLLGSAVGLGITTLITLLAGFGMLATALPLFLTLPFILLTTLSLSKARGYTKQIQIALDRAWKSAARDIVTKWGKPITARELSGALAISEAGAENLLSQLAVDDALRSEITPDGSLSFAPRLRIEASIDDADNLSADADLEARFEALAAQEAAAGQAKAKTYK